GEAPESGAACPAPAEEGHGGMTEMHTGGVPVVPTLAELGQRIRRLRVERRMTLKQLEEACGLSATHLSEVERGRTSPTVGALIRISRALAKEPAFFLDPDERMDAAAGLRGEGCTLTLAEGVTAEPLTHGIPGSSLFVYRLRLDPGSQLDL